VTKRRGYAETGEPIPRLQPMRAHLPTRPGVFERALPAVRTDPTPGISGNAPRAAREDAPPGTRVGHDPRGGAPRTEGAARRGRARREADRTARGLHTLREGADLLGVSYSTLAYQARKGVLATVHEGRFLYVDDAEIGRYRREHLRPQDRGDGGDRSLPRAPRGISVAEGAVDERSASGSMIHGGAQNSEPETVGEDGTDRVLHIPLAFDAEMGRAGRILPSTRHQRVGPDRAKAWHDAGASLTRSPRFPRVAVLSEKQIRTTREFSVAMK